VSRYSSTTPFELSSVKLQTVQGESILALPLMGKLRNALTKTSYLEEKRFLEKIFPINIPE